jgi:beta-glucosidase
MLQKFSGRVALLCCLLCAPIRLTAARAADVPLYKNPQANIDQRVDDLLSRMTVDEKAQQLRCLWQGRMTLDSGGAYDPAKASAVLANGIGGIGPIDMDVDKEVAERNAIQRYLVEQTRLGIPAMFHDEACHGFRDIGASSFPVPIGLACSWDPALTEKIYTAIAAEMRARGVSQALAPIVDIDRDPRWGRTDETMGEDPYLNGKMGAAMVRGLQGSADGTFPPMHVAATLKHFVGHGQPEGGDNRSPADVPPRELLDEHVMAFRIAINDSHPAGVMPAYIEVDGIPMHASVSLLRDLLRKELGFTGLIASDYEGMEFLYQVHHVAADMDDAAVVALRAGVEMNFPDGVATTHLAKLVEDGRVPMDELDAAVRHVLRLKFALGLFENPYGDAAAAKAAAQLDSTKQLALQAARESIVLLKNRDHLLPLPKDKFKTIAIIGPNADSDRLGSYSGEPLYRVSLLDGIKRKLGDDSRVVWAQGCKLATNLPDSSLDAWKDATFIQPPTEAENRADIAQAVEVAKQADLIVLALGENEFFCRESWSPNHIGDRSSLDLPGAQNDLADAIFALGKPVVVYLTNGRPLGVPNLVEKADAVLEGWYMGQETGNAAADILFGDVNPSGKLTITVPRSVGQVPLYYNCKPGARLYNYVDQTIKPLFPFGYGLSYTTFEYSDPRLSSPTMQTDGQVQVSETITNTGPVAGDEIVELYIHQLHTSVTRPIKELRGFQRVTCRPGESQTVTFTLDASALMFHDENMREVVEPGDVAVMVGPSSAALKSVMLTIQNISKH